MSFNNFSLPPHQLFEGPIKWYGVHDRNLAVLNPLEQQANLTDTWEDVLYSDGKQSPIEFRAFSQCLSMLIPSELSSVVTPSPEIARVRDVVICLDSEINPSKFFGRVALARGRIQRERQASIRWAVVGVAQRIAVGAFVERKWTPSLGQEVRSAGVTRMQVRPLLIEEADRIAHLAPPKST